MKLEIDIQVLMLEEVHLFTKSVKYMSILLLEQA